ncbi:MAG: hypothetical protein WBE09_13285, partial [Candidatus Acidiferrales bacterium]
QPAASDPSGKLIATATNRTRDPEFAVAVPAAPSSFCKAVLAFAFIVSAEVAPSQSTNPAVSRPSRSLSGVLALITDSRPRRERDIKISSL